MSINGSDTSSQIRQFGLYRSIDAKTEEFLKLSKKRQIKQGCACAAISTVITVALVISVIIIFEYSMIPNSKPKSNSRPNWLSFINNSLETMPFEVKFDKSKINPATVQILQLILKTIKKNVYFGKIIEDSINSSALYDKEGSTEDESYKNKITNTKSWVRFPVSKLYTIEYKTSPILYFKNPTRDIEYFTKIRKIRDYKRVMNYVDKMIGDKISLGTTIPMAKYIYNANRLRNVEYTTPMTKVKKGDGKYKNMKKKHSIVTTSTQTKEVNCNCKESVRDLLSKFIINLKELLPSATDKTHNTSTPCKMHSRNTKVKVHNKGNQSKFGFKFNNSLYNMSKENSYNMPEHYENQNEKRGDNKFIKLKGSIKDPTEKLNYTYRTFSTKQNLTEPYLTFNSNEQLSTTIRSIEYKENNKIQITLPGLETDYENYNNTEANIVDFFKVLDAHSLELVKTKTIPVRKEAEFSKNKNDTIISENISSSSPTYNTSESPKEFVIVDSKTNISDVKDSEHINIPAIDTTTHNDIIITTTQPIITDTSSLDNFVTKYSNNPSTTKDSMLFFDEITVEEEIDKISTDNPDISIKNLENMIKKLNNSTVYSNSNKGSEYDWEIVNVIDDKYNEDVPNSMIPQSRSSYLEIQRNEWKNEEQHDYDNNLNNYLLE